MQYSMAPAKPAWFKTLKKRWGLKMCTPQKDGGDSGTDRKTGAKPEGGRAQDVEMFAESDQK